MVRRAVICLGAAAALAMSGHVARASHGPVLTRSPSSLSFGNQQVGTTSFEQFVNVQNTGDADLVIGQVTITGSDASQFAVQSDTCSSNTLSPGGSCLIGVEFSPTSTGPKAASVSIPSNAPGTPHTVALSGSGVNPNLTRSPSSLAYGNQQINTMSFEQFVNVQNTGSGNGPLMMGTATVTGTGAAHFAKQSDTCSGVSLLPGGSCFISVQFTPTTTGAKSATLNIPSNAPTSPDPVSLSGTGVNAVLQRSPASLSFGNQQVNTSSFEQFVSVSNAGTGNGPLIIGTLTITGADASQFAFVSNNCSGTTLAPGGTCFFSVAFSPTSTGAKSASASIPSNAATSPDPVALSGTGVAPGLTRSPSTLAFGDQQVGIASPSQFVFVQNTGIGNGPLTMGSVAITGASADQFFIDSNNCSNVTLQPGGDCFVSVSFLPTSAGTKTASLNIPSNAPTSPDAVSLTGTGVLGLSISPTSVNFGTVEAGTPSAPRTVTVTNNGHDFISIHDSTLGGAHPDDFQVAADSCTGAQLFPDETCTYELRFTPVTVGARAGTLTIASEVGSFTVTLAGSGVDTTGPANTWTTESNAIRISTVQNVNGSASDPSGVDSVRVRFTDVLGAPTTVDATLSSCTPGNRSCDFEVVVPLLLPGPYTATILSDDMLGNRSEGPDITVIVL
jgi:hypothetical protein